MARPKTYRSEAIVLGYTALGEADLLVTLFTRDQGKVRAVGKGARRANSKLVGHLEPLTALKMSMVHAKSWVLAAGVGPPTRSGVMSFPPLYVNPFMVRHCPWITAEL